MFEVPGSSARRRALALLTVLALAFGAAACGSDDGDDGGSDGEAAAASGPQKQIETDYDEFIGNIYEGRWKQACAGYSSAYVKVYPKQIKIADTCVKTMALEFKTVGAQPRPFISKVKLKNAGRAIGFAKAREGVSAVPIKFTKEGGSWKLDGPAPQGSAKSG